MNGAKKELMSLIDVFTAEMGIKVKYADRINGNDNDRVLW